MHCLAGSHVHGTLTHSHPYGLPHVHMGTRQGGGAERAPAQWTRGTRRYSVMSISLLVAACACATLSRSLAASIFSSACSAASVAAFIS